MGLFKEIFDRLFHSFFEFALSLFILFLNIVEKFAAFGLGHLSLFLENDPPEFPFVALLASGGHTSIYHVTDHITMELMGQTRDDAAGEAFDKVAKVLDLGYPGGGVIDRLAKQGDSSHIKFPRSYLDKASYDFSFSGIKTAVNRYAADHRDRIKDHIPDIAAGFQEAVLEVLTHKAVQAAVEKNCDRLALVGGVAANSRLREMLKTEASRQGMRVHIPSIHLCGDNAAMIAAAGYHYVRAGIEAELGDDVYSRAK